MMLLREIIEEASLFVDEHPLASFVMMIAVGLIVMEVLRP